MSTGKNNLIWLVSYPKSGNTWMRLFLHALKTGCECIDSLDVIKAADGIASSRLLIDGYLGGYSAEFPDSDIQKLRPEVYRLLSNDLTEEKMIFKVHDAIEYDGTLLFPQDVTYKVIYIVRNPFDMVASYANHMGYSIEKSLSDLSDRTTKIANNKAKLEQQVTQHLGSWSDHFNGWMKIYSNNILVVRYEDLQDAPLTTFTEVVKALGWNKTQQEIEQAILVSQFDKIKKVEEEKGFAEKSKKSERFFRQGKKGNWKNEISIEQAHELISKHYETLVALHYIDKQKNILV